MRRDQPVSWMTSCSSGHYTVTPSKKQTNKQAKYHISMCFVKESSYSISCAVYCKGDFWSLSLSALVMAVASWLACFHALHACPVSTLALECTWNTYMWAGSWSSFLDSMAFAIGPDPHVPSEIYPSQTSYIRKIHWSIKIGMVSQAEENIQRWRALATLAEDMSWVLSTHVG